MQSIKKPPRVFPGRCSKSRKELSQKPADLLPEILETVCVAVAQNLQRAGEVQTGHADKALGIYQLAVIAHQNHMTVEELKPYYDTEFEAAVIRSVLTSKVMKLIRDAAEITVTE